MGSIPAIETDEWHEQRAEETADWHREQPLTAARYTQSLIMRGTRISIRAEELSGQLREAQDTINEAHYLSVCARNIINRFEGDLDDYERGILEQVAAFVRKTD